MFKLNKTIQIAILATLLLLIIFLYSEISHLFVSFYALVQIIFVPVLLAVFFYYLIRPVINYMEKQKINRMLSILVLFLVLTALLVWFILAMYPILSKQLMSLLDNAPAFFNDIGKYIVELQQNEFFQSLFPAATDFQWSTVTSYLNKILASLDQYIGSIVEFVSNFTIILITTPILLFFMLKDSEKLPRNIINGTPIRFKDDVKEMLNDFDGVLSNYIVGRVIVNFALAVLMYIGFLIIDLPYALLLTTIAFIANFIPFIGAFLSSIPIVIVALVQSPTQAMWALIIILVAQQIQDNLIAPYIFGKQLKIHPLTTIILVLGAGKIGGIIAMIIIIPVYLILKIIAQKVYKLFYKEKWENI